MLADDGALAHSLPGFTPRAAQQRMAQAVAEALEDGETLIVEAGTGTGKTYAYLTPALLSGKRVVVSTGTRNLQDQLYHRDLPRLLQALKTPARAALLKGRSNYLCLYRLKRAGQMPGGRFDQRLNEIDAWSRASDAGELAELRTLAEDDPLWARVTSTADNCLGAKCPDFGQCFVVKARRAAQGADVVVVNHHLLLADFIIRDEGFGEILPGADAVVVDEAHQLPELASQFFGSRVSTRQLRDIAQDTLTESGEWADMPQLDKAAEDLAAAAVALEGVFATVAGRLRLDEFVRRPAAPRLMDEVAAQLEVFFPVVDRYSERSPALLALSERAALLQERWSTVAKTDAGDDNRVRWVEARGRGGSLHATPIEVAEGFQRLRAMHAGAWVFTSATLSAAGDFGHFQHQLGLDEARTLALDSPFEFARQARLYLPRGMPEPNDPAYSEAVIRQLLPVIEASNGGVFVLCTSHRALRIIAERLRQSISLPLFVQNEDNRMSLVERFARAGNGVLVGTSSFWEGVDVRGQALRVVVIDRLPFAAPGDPVFDAKLEAIRARGGNPFFDHQLPEAIVMLRQGAGRLIRDASDRGLLMICDPRLRTKPYGRKLLASLPPMPVLEQWADAKAWLADLAAPQPVPERENVQETPQLL